MSHHAAGVRTPRAAAATHAHLGVGVHEVAAAQERFDRGRRHHALLVLRKPEAAADHAKNKKPRSVGRCQLLLQSANSFMLKMNVGRYMYVPLTGGEVSWKGCGEDVGFEGLLMFGR